MTQRVQTQRSPTTLNRPPTTRPVGEFYVNFADRQFGVVDDTPAVQDLLPVRWHSPRAQYIQGDWVRSGTSLYQAKSALAPKAFTLIDWDPLFSQGQADLRYLALAGGSMTGPLALNADPSSALQASTKQYVDTQAGTRVVKSGDTMTGLLTLSGAPTSNLHAATKLYVDTGDATKLNLSGGTLTGALTLSGAPTANLQAATKQYVDGAVSGASYLPLAGGTLTGTLTVPQISYSTHPGHTFAWNWTGSTLQAFVDGTNVGNVAIGSYMPTTGGAFSGDISAPDVISNAFIGGNVYARGGTVYFGPGDTGYLSQDGTSCTLRLRSDGWNLFWNGSNGTLSFGSPSAVLWDVDSAGNGYFRGALNTGGNVNAPGGVFTNVSASGNVTAASYNGNTALISADGYVGILHTTSSVSQGASGWQYTSTGSSAFSGTVSYGILCSSGVLASYLVAQSDIRLKFDVQSIDPMTGVDWVSKSRPVTYRKRHRHDASDDESIYEAGFIAQDQIRAGYGEFVATAPAPGTPELIEDGLTSHADTQLGLDSRYQIAMLTAALQDVLARLAVLEAKEGAQ